MGRPGGNPELEKYQFEQKYDWSEPCSAKMTLRLPPSQYAKLKEIDCWQEKVREAIASLLELEQGQLDSTATSKAVAAEPAGTTRHSEQAPTDRAGEGIQEDETGNARAKGKSKGGIGARPQATKTPRGRTRGN